MVLLSAVKELEALRINDTYYWRGGAYYAYMLKPLLQALQEKINDREAVCHKVSFADNGRLTVDPTPPVRFEQFRIAVYRYLRDRSEPELVDDDDAVTSVSGPATVVRRDTGRPKRAAVKAISYAEGD